VVLSERAETSPDVSNIYVLDATRVGLGARVIPRLSGAAGLMGDTSVAGAPRRDPATVAQAESTALRSVMRRKRVGYLVLDANTLAGRSARYAGWNASAFPDIERITRAVHGAVLSYRLAGAGLDPDRIASLTNVPLKVDAERVTETGRAGPGCPAPSLAMSWRSCCT